jgi:two-component system, response regulator PdtaR
MEQNSSSGPVVVVVEDEELLRVCAMEILGDAGFTALEAADADEALSILERNPDVRLVFTDINMPGDLDGLDLAREVHKRWPNIRLLVTSGRHLLKDSDIPDDGKFLAKPYKGERMVGLVEKLISTPEKHSE